MIVILFCFDLYRPSCLQPHSQPPSRPRCICLQFLHCSCIAAPSHVSGLPDVLPHVVQTYAASFCCSFINDDMSCCLRPFALRATHIVQCPDAPRPRQTRTSRMDLAERARRSLVFQKDGRRQCRVRIAPRSLLRRTCLQRFLFPLWPLSNTLSHGHCARCPARPLCY